MYYIDKIPNFKNKYISYIYYNYDDLYFIYDNDNNNTTLYDIGDLNNTNIKKIFNDSKINVLNNIY
jgi:hypothetical protein